MDETGVVVAEGTEHPLRQALSIGRDPENDIVIGQTTVSRHHAVRMRKLSLNFSLDAQVPEDLRNVMGEDAVGASFSFDLGLDKISEPVQIPG